MLRLSALLILLTSPSLACAQESAFMEAANSVFAHINDFLAPIIFWDIPFIKLPLVVFVMFAGGIFFTFRFGFINVRLFPHAINVIRGKYDDPDHPGEISHFQALSSALSATVGLGNIAGVAVAIQLGGPGAVFWLWVAAFFGMCMKFSSCTFAQLYRDVDPETGAVLGGPMVYLKKAFASRWGLIKTGTFVGSFYAFITIMSSLAAGNMFQSNQTYELLSNQFDFLQNAPLAVGVTLAFFAGIVLIGGIKRIADVTSKLVPLMCIFYVVSCLIIIFSNISEVPAMFASIFYEAFNPESAFAGGALGVFIQGIRRASFSNEAGLGTAAIAHAAAKTDEPVREGLVAMIGPSIDTHIVCTMTALSILITGAHLDPALDGMGAQVTAAAFGTLGSYMPVLLTIATVIFSYSTVVSYSYYGEKATEFLFGRKAIKFFRFIYVFVIILGPVLTLQKVIEFADLMFLTLAFPNIIGMAFLSKEVKNLLDNYKERFYSGKMKTFK